MLHGVNYITMFGVTPDVKSPPTNSTTVHTSSDFVLMDKKQIKATAAIGFKSLSV